jgi:hypothetical protein
LVHGSDVEDVFSMNAPNVVDYFNHPDNHQINMRFANGAVSNLNFVIYLGETDHTDPFPDQTCPSGSACPNLARPLLSKGIF